MVWPGLDILMKVEMGRPSGQRVSKSTFPVIIYHCSTPQTSLLSKTTNSARLNGHI